MLLQSKAKPVRGRSCISLMGEVLVPDDWVWRFIAPGDLPRGHVFAHCVLGLRGVGYESSFPEFRARRAWLRWGLDAMGGIRCGEGFLIPCDHSHLDAEPFWEVVWKDVPFVYAPPRPSPEVER